MVEGPRARAAWRVLDAQYFGVAQRRRRVFVVIDFGGRVDPAAVLFERKSLRGNSPPRRETGEGFARGFETGPHGGRFTEVAPTLDTSCQDGPVRAQIGAGAITARTGRAISLQDANQGHIISQWPAEVASTLNATFASKQGLEDQHINGGASYFVPIAFDCKGTEVQHDTLTPPLCAMGHAGSHSNGGGHAAIAIQERVVSENSDSGPDGAGFRDDDAAYTLEARTVPQTVAFDLRGREGGAMPEGPHDTANIRAASGGSSRSYVASPYAVRRLTPTECHRLQGLPDDHCAITYRRKPAADGPQYKALGNSMAVPCIKWILDRIRISAARRVDNAST